MGKTVVLVGPYEAMNAIAGAETVTPTDADPNFGKDFARDGEPGSVFRFGSAATTLNYDADLDQLAGNFETWTVSSHPDGWEDASSGTGSVEEETTAAVVNEGSSSAQLNGSGAGNEGRIRRRRKWLAGQVINVTVALYGNGIAAVSAYVRNMRTGMYLLSTGAWTATRTAFATKTTTGWATTTASGVVIEDAATCKAGVVELVYEAETTAAQGRVDSFYSWPSWDLSAVFGHNFESNWTVKVESDDNAAFSSPTDRVTHTIRRPSFFGTIDSLVNDRYARLSIVGDKLDPPEVGEWVVGPKWTLPRAVELPYTLVPDVGTFDLEIPASVREDEAMNFPVTLFLTAANWDDLRLRLMSASRWGGNRTVLVPDDSREEVYFGTLRVQSIERTPANSYRVSMEFRELDYAVKVQ